MLFPALLLVRLAAAAEGPLKQPIPQIFSVNIYISLNIHEIGLLLARQETYAPTFFHFTRW
jgi:hypothetical protein